MRPLIQDDYDRLSTALGQERRRVTLWQLATVASLLITVLVGLMAFHATHVAAECLSLATAQRASLDGQREAIQHYDRLLREQLDTSRTVIGELERCRNRRVFHAGL